MATKELKLDFEELVRAVRDGEGFASAKTDSEQEEYLDALVEIIEALDDKAIESLLKATGGGIEQARSAAANLPAVVNSRRFPKPRKQAEIVLETRSKTEFCDKSAFSLAHEIFHTVLCVEARILRETAAAHVVIKSSPLTLLHRVVAASNADLPGSPKGYLSKRPVGYFVEVASDGITMTGTNGSQVFLKKSQMLPDLVRMDPFVAIAKKLQQQRTEID